MHKCNDHRNLHVGFVGAERNGHSVHCAAQHAQRCCGPLSIVQQRRNHGNATASRYRSLLLQAVDGLPPSERTLAQGLLGKLDPLVLSQLTRGARKQRDSGRRRPLASYRSNEHRSGSVEVWPR